MQSLIVKSTPRCTSGWIERQKDTFLSIGLGQTYCWHCKARKSKTQELEVLPALPSGAVDLTLYYFHPFLSQSISMNVSFLIKTK